VVSISLYGCETWSLTEQQLGRLRVMQAQHFRAMSRVTRKHAWTHHISTQELGRQLGLDSIDMYVARRQARWLGHVRRMPFLCPSSRGCRAACSRRGCRTGAQRGRRR
jgi:hypothetical protein